MSYTYPYLLLITAFWMFSACSSDSSGDDQHSQDRSLVLEYTTIDIDQLPNYANQSVPNYITRDNTQQNPITDAGAALGRVLFYDKNLSTTKTISCSSCHDQSIAFTDKDQVSEGINGTTPRHSMRLINARFGEEIRFFWDERASTLEAQTTMPIKDHIELGFSGENGDQNFEDLVQHLSSLPYYPILFEEAFGNSTIDESKIQNALAQFIRSIQSFDSKFDQGRAGAANDLMRFPNFTNEEHRGKQLFINPPVFDDNGFRIQGGVGCAGCHNPPEFSIANQVVNNGVVRTASDPNVLDPTVSRSPSLRDVFNPDGSLNSSLMHTGNFNTMLGVINHYNEIPDLNQFPNPPRIDPRLTPNNMPQRLQLTEDEKASIIAFLKTLTGSDVYVNEKWSDPFR